jgi:FAD/FMN-containing dehydrogenase
MPETTLDATATDDLRSRLQGSLVTPDDEGYDAASRTANGMFDDKRPAAVAQCASVADVRAALAAARAQDLIVAVRGGGHSSPGFSTCDGGMVIDLRAMNRVEVDPEQRIARVQAGANWGELDAATQEHGLAVTGGRVTDTGVAGLTLGSGSGWLERMYGVTCASLIAAEMVTADGEVITASESENPELLWGLRGAGGNFGIVTEFTFRLHPVGPIVLAGQLGYPREGTKERLRAYRDYMESAADEVGGGMALLTAPPLDFIPEPVRGQPITGVIFCYIGDVEAGQQALQELKEKLGPPALDMVQPMPYTALQAMIDESAPRGIREYYKFDFLEALSDEAIDTLVDAVQPPSPHSQVIIEPLGGEYSRTDRSTMALEAPDAPWAYHALTMWFDPAENDVNVAYAREFSAAMAPYGTGVAYANFVNPDEIADRWRGSFSDEKWSRLIALKRQWDPDNVFRLNVNIPPAATDGSAS